MFALMERQGEKMNVPEGQIAAFEADGWVVVQKFETAQPTENIHTSDGEITPEEAIEKVAKRSKKKK